LFGFVTGVSIAAAAAFSRIAYPEMRRYGYRRDFALGSVAGVPAAPTERSIG
jgi:TRAP-type C4-dicarboxylate transport system permease large subunit